MIKFGINFDKRSRLLSVQTTTNMKQLILVFCCCFYINGISQNFSLQPKGKPKEVAIDFHLTHNQFVPNQSTDGIQLEARIYPKKWWALGLGLTSSNTAIPSYKTPQINHPSLYFLEISPSGWLDFIQHPRFRFSGLLAPGLAVTNIQNKAFNTNPWTGRKYPETVEIISKNLLATFSTGCAASFRIYANDHQPDIFITSQWRYRKTWGQHAELPNASFSGSQWSIGITLIGWDRDTKKIPTYLLTTL
jgi:hypothetical protein